ncbi:hypothetical protein MNBD_ALPHA01-611 [hydrothermal vent metagenome]|uniref:Uncharacterized protein n=1 Tax=hydrothermal vent metagenome TaxID=652676 RepID=A0A3B0RQN3_9ZZZZ
MGILIAIGLVVVVWKVIDLAKQKAAREKREALQQEQTIEPATAAQISGQLPFAHDLPLGEGEKIIEISPAANGLWIRIGADGVTRRIILKDFAGRTIGTIKIKRDDEDAASAN